MALLPAMNVPRRTMRIGGRIFVLSARASHSNMPPSAPLERAPLRFFGREDAAIFLRRVAAEPEGRDGLRRLAHDAIGGAGIGARSAMEEAIAVLAGCLARGSIVVTPMDPSWLPGLDGERVEAEEAPLGVPVQRAESEPKLWEGSVRTTEPPRWKAGWSIGPPQRWTGRISVRET